MPKTKASLLVIAATVLTVATLFLLPFTPKIAVRTSIVERGELIRSSLMEGVVSYVDEQPCIALQAGKVAQVHVRQGQQVRAGDLLFSMDTSGKEEALAAVTRLIFEQEEALAAFGETGSLALSAVESSLEARRQQEQLKASIAAGQIRAAADGVMGGVYTGEGAYVAELTVLGTVHGAGKCVLAAGRAADIAGVKPGAAALIATAGGQSLGAAVLTQTGAPALDEATAQAMQPLSFLPADEAALRDIKVGDRVTVELVCETLGDMALVPLSAVDSADRVWFVENGAATPVKIDLSQRNDQFVAISAEWAGKRVVLLPEARALYPGCAVKEARDR